MSYGIDKFKDFLHDQLDIGTWIKSFEASFSVSIHKLNPPPPPVFVFFFMFNFSYLLLIKI